MKESKDEGRREPERTVLFEVSLHRVRSLKVNLKVREKMYGMGIGKSNVYTVIAWLL